LAVWAVLVLGGIVAIFDANIRAFALPAVLLVAVTLVIIMRLNQSGRTRLASQIIVGIVLLGFTYLNFMSAGEPRPLILLTIIAILMGGLLLGPSGAMYAAIFLVLQNTVITSLSIQGIIAPQDALAPPIEYIVVNGAAYLLIGFMFRLAIQRIQFAVNQLQVSNRDLQEFSTALEQRVAARTKDLATVAEVGTATATILETDKLLQAVVDLTKERFELYHSHIYLLDESGENLVLASGAGEPGRQMKAKGLSIPLNREQSLVARAARERKGVIVNDVTQAPDFLPNPLLLDTRSELAVPMIVGGKVIGVFDVQSNQIGRFTESDINIQTTLAAQVSTSIQNVRSFEQSKAQADLESMVNAIGQKIQLATSVDDTLQTAIREIGLALGASRVSANIQTNRQGGSNN
jgi:putative methionine-R-sulfoxide reductase with GAF domain